jgi:hypothetical protein
VTLDALLDSLAPNQTVDYLKVDIEGGERELFRAGGSWSERTRVLKVEVHEPYSVSECIADLSRLGFSATPDEGHWATVVAYGNPPAAGEEAVPNKHTLVMRHDDASERDRVSRRPDEELLRLDPLELRDQLVAEAAADFDVGRVAEGIAALERLRLATVDEKTLDGTDAFLRRIAGNRRIVATTNLARRPLENEVVIAYGSFPHSYENVVVNNPIRRHVGDFGDLPYDTFQFDERWSGISTIAIINDAHRLDRRDAVMGQLAAAHAPLDRVFWQPALPGEDTGNPALDGQVGCLRSHLSALKALTLETHEHALVLEDDFCFTSDLETHLDDVAEFTRRRYDYIVCLAATSKYGRVAPRDDLVSESRQPVTNAGGYLVSGAHVERLVAIQAEGLERLIATGDTSRFSADRYWALLQTEGRFLVLRRKLGYQAASFSDIERRVTRYLD